MELDVRKNNKNFYRTNASLSKTRAENKGAGIDYY
jgi:hypothetical protein